jgi:hypothetical protein
MASGELYLKDFEILPVFGYRSKSASDYGRPVGDRRTCGDKEFKASAAESAQVKGNRERTS